MGHREAPLWRCSLPTGCHLGLTHGPAPGRRPTREPPPRGSSSSCLPLGRDKLLEPAPPEEPSSGPLRSQPQPRDPGGEVTQVRQWLLMTSSDSQQTE